MQGSGVERDFAFGVGGKWNSGGGAGVIDDTAVDGNRARGALRCNCQVSSKLHLLCREKIMIL